MMLSSLLLGLVVIVIIAACFTMGDLWDMARVSLFGSRNDASHVGGTAFDPARDIPSQAGKVILITGGAGALGREATIELARYGRPARIYIADLPRDEEAKKALGRQIIHEAYDSQPESSEPAGSLPPRTEIQFLDLDLSSFDAVRRCAAEFVAREQRLDVLFCNAGIIRVPPLMTKEGYEIHFGTNYLGHALLCQLLMPTLLQTTQQQPDADVRVIILSSEGHLVAPKNGVEFDKVKTDCSHINYVKRYGQSKVALIGLARTLARQYPQIKTIAVHPGRIVTGLAAGLAKESTLARLATPIGRLVCVSPTVGVRNHLWTATSPDVVSGTYYEPVGVPGGLSIAAKDETLHEVLRAWTNTALSGVKPLD